MTVRNAFPRRGNSILSQKIFERKILYWDCRPMPNDPGTIVSPADSRVILGSLSDMSSLFIKGKFFEFDELIGRDKKSWLAAFREWGFCRFPPDTGKVPLQPYTRGGEGGRFLQHPRGLSFLQSLTRSCRWLRHTRKTSESSPFLTPMFLGERNIGLVAMIEVVALMIGGIVQCVQQEVLPMTRSPSGAVCFVEKGRPKSLFRPGSSTVVLLFERDKVRFADDILANMSAFGVDSLFSKGFGQPMVETDIKVRSLLGSVRKSKCREATRVIQ